MKNLKKTYRKCAINNGQYHYVRTKDGGQRNSGRPKR